MTQLLGKIDLVSCLGLTNPDTPNSKIRIFRNSNTAGSGLHSEKNPDFLNVKTQIHLPSENKSSRKVNFLKLFWLLCFMLFIQYYGFIIMRHWTQVFRNLALFRFTNQKLPMYMVRKFSKILKSSKKLRLLLNILMQLADIYLNSGMYVGVQISRKLVIAINNSKPDLGSGESG